MAYMEQLTEGATFFRNHNGEYVVVKSGFGKDKETIYVLTKAAYVYRELKDGDWRSVPVAEIIDNVSNLDLPHSIAEVKFEDGLFVHGRVERGFHPTADLYDLFDDLIQI